jgi:16S rRNA (uracil1498-N3)-methyltransferase
MRRFFVTPEAIQADSITLQGDDYHHLVNVLRQKIGDKIEVKDGHGNTYFCQIGKVGKETAELLIITRKEDPSSSPIQVTLAQSLPKNPKLDWIIQKTTELGVNQIIPVIGDRSVPDIAKKADKKQERWQKIAEAAAKQSGRPTVPEVIKPMSFKETLKLAVGFELALFFYELEKDVTLKACLEAYLKANPKKHPVKILIFVGPEGGYSHKEVELAKASNLTFVSLGKNILRTETAPITILSNLNFFFDQ